MIESISHITFIVRDLDRATEFFTYIFEAREVYTSGDRKYSLSREKFFLINDLWIAIMEGDRLDKSYNHIAFKIDEEDYDMYYERIENLGLTIKEPRDRVEGEARSIYFYDFDNHLFEFHTGSLDDRLKAYKEN